MNSPYRRELNDYRKDSLKKQFKYFVENSRNSCLTKKQRVRLLELKKKDQGTTDSDFWYRIKKDARNAIVDLQMICKIANDEQLKEIFQNIPINKIEENVPIRYEDIVTVPRLIDSVLITNLRSEKQEDLWKSLLVKDLMNVCLNYIVANGILMTKSHIRLIDEIRDLVDSVVSVSTQVPTDKRSWVKF